MWFPSSRLRVQEERCPRRGGDEDALPPRINEMGRGEVCAACLQCCFLTWGRKSLLNTAVMCIECLPHWINIWRLFNYEAPQPRHSCVAHKPLEACSDCASLPGTLEGGYAVPRHCDHALRGKHSSHISKSKMWLAERTSECRKCCKQGWTFQAYQ